MARADSAEGKYERGHRLAGRFPNAGAEARKCTRVASRDDIRLCSPFDHRHRVVWALSCSYWTLYEQLAGKSAATGAIAVPATPELDEALRLFSWAISRAQGGSATWPVNTPSPTMASVRAIVATELTLGAVAVYLIHELHHINVSQPMTEANSTWAAPDDATEEEYDADAYAASTVLRSAPEEGRVKRTLGLAVGLLVIAGHWLSAEREHPSDHPPGVERPDSRFERSSRT